MPKKKGMRRKLRVNGNKMLVFGDLHVSDTYVGNHKDYLSESFWVLGRIEKICEDERPDVVVFLGDLDMNISKRIVLLKFCKFFARLNALTNGNVYCVKGNHDMHGNFSVFSFLAGLGYIKIAQDETVQGYIDLYCGSNQEVPAARFHLVDYGREKEQLPILDVENSNIVLAHNNFSVPGYTTWYQDYDGLELSRLSSMKDISLIISGHIHNPSPDTLSVQHIEGTVTSLFYPGCPTRPAKDTQKYDFVYYVKFEYKPEGDYIDWQAKQFDLLPTSECFIENDLSEKTEEQVAEELRLNNLSEVLNEIMEYQISGNDLVTQIENIPSASNEAKKIAIDYIKKVSDNA